MRWIAIAQAQAGLLCISVMTWSISPTEGSLMIHCLSYCTCPLWEVHQPYARSAPVLALHRKHACTTPVLSTSRKCARTFGRFISRSFVDNPFQGSKNLLLYQTVLGEASRQLSLFAPTCSSFQASPTPGHSYPLNSSLR